jgi:tetratricopeptide (TPR) repeat protein
MADSAHGVRSAAEPRLAAGIGASEAAEYFEEAVSLAQRLNDMVSYALVVQAYGRILVARGSADEYVRQVEIAQRLAEQTRRGGLQVTLLASLCQAQRMAGRLREAMTASEMALARIKEVRSLETRMLGFDPYLWLLGLRAQCSMYLGQFDESKKELDTLLGGLNETIDLALQVMPHIAYVEMAALIGDAKLAARHTDAAAELSARSGSPYLQVHALAAQGIGRRLAGDHAKAEEHFKEALALARETNSGLEYEGRMLCELAEVQLRMNRGPWLLKRPQRRSIPPSNGVPGSSSARRISCWPRCTLRVRILPVSRWYSRRLSAPRT